MGDNKSQFFAVVDLDGQRLSARSSIFHETKPAIAALLALDEVILEKQEALFAPEVNFENSHEQQETNHCDDKTIQIEKPLRLSFYMAGQNLCFKAYWNATGKLVFPDRLSRCGHTLSYLFELIWNWETRSELQCVREPPNQQLRREKSK
jgi:hypothetical protein